jgi:NAD(P)-dependent dehydrogenase (short-subunit alcohol dehydrogenase family)
MNLQGRIAIVTGAGGGLGRAHALLLARHGAKVVVNDLGEGADTVAREIVDAGGEALAFQASVTDEARIQAMVAATIERWGRVDILVNNAGILRDKSFGKMSLEDFRLVVEVHLMGSVICTKAVWETMRQQGYGRIVMTTSSSGLYGNFGQSNYGAAKMALVGLMQTLAIEGQKHGIRVNCLAPTAATLMTEGIMKPQSVEVMTPESVSPGVVVLSSDDAPTRMILCAGAGTFEAAHITLTQGRYIGTGPDAADELALQLDGVRERSAETVPESGASQGRNEVAQALAAVPA